MGQVSSVIAEAIFGLTSITLKISKKRGKYQNKTWSYPASVSPRTSSMLYFFDFSFLAYKCLLMTSDYQQNIKIELAKVILSRITNEVSVLIQKNLGLQPCEKWQFQISVNKSGHWPTSFCMIESQSWEGTIGWTTINFSIWFVQCVLKQCTTNMIVATW